MNDLTSPILEDHAKGFSNVEIARKFKLSASKVSYVINREKKRDVRQAKRIVWRDESVAMFGTWSQTVCLLLPHLQAIKAIAEEKRS